MNRVLHHLPEPCSTPSHPHILIHPLTTSTKYASFLTSQRLNLVWPRASHLHLKQLLPPQAFAWFARNPPKQDDTQSAANVVPSPPCPHNTRIKDFFLTTRTCPRYRGALTSARHAYSRSKQSQVLCVGANYSSHLKEIGLPVEKKQPIPFFSRPPTTPLVGPGQTARKPRVTKQLDWEVELVIVLGKQLLHAESVDEVADAIAGFSVGMDLSFSDLQTARLGPGTVMMDVSRGKHKILWHLWDRSSFPRSS